VNVQLSHFSFIGLESVLIDFIGQVLGAAQSIYGEKIDLLQNNPSVLLMLVLPKNFCKVEADLELGKELHLLKKFKNTINEVAILAVISTKIVFHKFYRSIVKLHCLMYSVTALLEYLNSPREKEAP